MQCFFPFFFVYHESVEYVHAKIATASNSDFQNERAYQWYMNRLGFNRIFAVPMEDYIILPVRRYRQVNVFTVNWLGTFLMSFISFFTYLLLLKDVFTSCYTKSQICRANGRKTTTTTTQMRYILIEATKALLSRALENPNLSKPYQICVSKDVRKPTTIIYRIETYTVKTYILNAQAWCQQNEKINWFCWN